MVANPDKLGLRLCLGKPYWDKRLDPPPSQTQGHETQTRIQTHRQLTMLVKSFGKLNVPYSCIWRNSSFNLERRSFMLTITVTLVCNESIVNALTLLTNLQRV